MKSQNSHLHILEGFDELAKVWREPLLLRRLEEVIDVLQNRLLDATGSLHGIALADWTPQPWPVSYGHNIEAAHLLLSASETLYGQASTQTQEAAAKLVNHTLRHGIDRGSGGVFNVGDPQGPTDRSKVWWVQAEALLGFARALRLQGVAETQCEEALLATWDFIKNRQIDREYGGWVDTIRPDGSVAGDGKKAHPWKAAYHDGRALLFTSRLLDAA
jgi:mannobiose 2-epimerase